MYDHKAEAREFIGQDAAEATAKACSYFALAADALVVREARDVSGGPVFTVFENKYWVDELYWAVILRPYIWLSRFLAEQVDWRFWHDWLHDTLIARGFRGLARFLAGPLDLGVIDVANGLANLTVRFASNLRRIQTGFVRNYALSVLIVVGVIIGYLVLQLR